MNLSQVAIEKIEDTQSQNLERHIAEEARVVRIIEAIQGVQDSKEWSTLKTEVFDSLVNVLEKDLKTEAKKEDPDPKKLNRLSGELKWAEKYSDLTKLEISYRTQLQGIRKHIHGKESE